MSILEFQHVSKVYHNTTRALDDLSFSVNEGEFVSIIGPIRCRKIYHSALYQPSDRRNRGEKSSMTAKILCPCARDSCETCAPKPE